jgi:cysteinyl-tRNA synthetase
MDDDLNVTEALAILFNFIREVNKLMDKNKVSQAEAKEIRQLMYKFDKILGVIEKAEKLFEKGKLSREIQELIEKREEARKLKDWKTADEIREKLRQMGITLEDTPKGVKWKIRRPPEPEF